MDRSRGQVILVAALGIAVTLVALALVTNTAIYTENLATRETVSGQDAIAFEQSMDDGASDLLALANRYNASSHTSIRDRFAADVNNLSSGTGTESAAYGELTAIEVVNTTNGSRISLNETRNFTSADGDGNWTLASDVDAHRRFEMNVSQSALNDTGSPFRIVINTTTHEWNASVADGGDDNVSVAISNETTNVTCSVSANTTVFDVTEGTLAGESCDAPTAASTVDGPYDISFENASNVEGRFVLFVDRTKSEIADHYDPAPDTPSIDPAIYDATVHVTVRQPDLTYETNVTVAPERSPEGEVYGTVP